jgi:hypothetical protein
MRFYILLFLSSILGIQGLAQSISPIEAFHIEKTEYEYINMLDGSDYYVREYKVVNTSNDYYYSWIDYSATKHENRDELVKRYFRTFHGDFNLVTLLTDNCVFEGFRPVIGRSFLKRINPHSAFRYILISQEKNFSIFNEEKLITICQSNLGEWANASFNESVLFDADYIVLYLIPPL